MVRAIFGEVPSKADWLASAFPMAENDERGRSELDGIDARLRAARGVQKAEADRGREGPARSSGMGIAFRIGIELVTTVLVGLGIGIVLDRWLGTAPWLMVVLIFLGGAAGVMNVYRVVRGLDDSVGLGRAVERKKAAERKETNSPQDS